MAGNYHTKSNWFSKWYIMGRQQYNGYSCHSKKTGYVCHNTWMCTMFSCLQERLIDSKLCFWWLVSFVLTRVWKIYFNTDLSGGVVIFMYFCTSFKINHSCRLLLQFPNSWETKYNNFPFLSYIKIIQTLQKQYSCDAHTKQHSLRNYIMIPSKTELHWKLSKHSTAFRINVSIWEESSKDGLVEAGKMFVRLTSVHFNY